MEYVLYLSRFLYRIRWWVIIGTTVVTIAVIFATRNMAKKYHVEATLYTGVVSGYSIESDNGGPNWAATNNEMDNMVNIIKAENTLKRVSYRLYARNMIHGNLKHDNEYITAASYREIYNRTVNRQDGQAILALIDKNSEDKTLENLLKYERPNKDNFVYGLFYWYHPHYSYNALKNIKVQKAGSSDLLQLSYSCNDPGIAYNTLDILINEFVHEYRSIRYGETDKVIEYFRSELARIGHKLRLAEDSLTQYNIDKRVINYSDETKEVASIDKEFELREQNIQFAYNSSKIMMDELEKRMNSNVKQMRNNISFINKLNEASKLTSKISEIESFATKSSQNKDLSLQAYKDKLLQTTKELSNISDDYVTQKNSKNGIAQASIVDQWLEQLLRFEKAKSDLAIIQKSRKDLDKKYVFFAPVGSTIKRKERNISFTESTYLSLLRSYNDALMRKKNLEMTSATLKVLNPPAFPISAEETDRRKIVMASFVGSIIFIFGFFLFIELFDKTLRDKQRTERLTGETVVGAFPIKPLLKNRKYSKAYALIASRYLSSTALRFFSRKKDNNPYIVNFLSTESGDGKTYLAVHLEEYWNQLGLKVRRLEWEKDFDVSSREYLLAQSINDLYTPSDEDILIVEYPNLKDNTISKNLLIQADLNLLITSATRSWKATDKQACDKVKEQTSTSSAYIYLNKATNDVVEDFTGLLPPYTITRKIEYQLTHLGLTEKIIAPKNG
ncbi:hypothetical protein [uncultured Bacteroides sp.]|uniref:GumC family protein n=1 Tax=uncultured Bacteroides sp. TaxID=162156 RepID=UPI002AAB95DE|nr:hypothetical protein [uncultured Bacteroides sp.]